MDPGYRRLFYARYADDHLLGLIGPKAEAEEIKTKLAAFLRETLALELNTAKTLVTHARTGAARPPHAGRHRSDRGFRGSLHDANKCEPFALASLVRRADGTDRGQGAGASAGRQSDRVSP